MLPPVSSESEIPGQGQVLGNARHLVAEQLIFAVPGRLPPLLAVSWGTVHLVRDVFQMARVHLVLVQKAILHNSS
jgi:hypothetical protein